jgi:hypothetical protein
LGEFFTLVSFFEITEEALIFGVPFFTKNITHTFWQKIRLGNIYTQQTNLATLRTSNLTLAKVGQKWVRFVEAFLPWNFSGPTQSYVE